MTAAESSQEISGFALRCDAGGLVLEVMRNTPDAQKDVLIGEWFVNLVDRASQTKAEAFLSTLREQKAAFGWELNVRNENGSVESMHFAGALAETGEDGETFLIVAARSRTAVSKFYNDLTRLNNEQANSLRTALKDLSLQMREQNERDSLFYDELSRLNNELTTTQRELAKKNFELARLNEQKNQFLGIASHDLRNPLEVILTYSEFLLEDTAEILSGEQTEFIHKIRSSSAYMLNLVNDFLDYSRIEAGRLELDPSPVDPAKLIYKTVERCRVIADKKQIAINFSAPENLPEISVDESKIEQVLANLLGNAVKFSPAGSRVEVRLESSENELIIAVRDSGQGISPQDVETLFAPFVKGKNKATSGEKGTGLGLAIVKKIVEAHGGAISFETETGAGSVFKIALPIKFEQRKN